MSILWSKHKRLFTLIASTASSLSGELVHVVVEVPLEVAFERSAVVVRAQDAIRGHGVHAAARSVKISQSYFRPIFAKLWSNILPMHL